MACDLGAAMEEMRASVLHAEVESDSIPPTDLDFTNGLTTPYISDVVQLPRTQVVVVLALKTAHFRGVLL